MPVFKILTYPYILVLLGCLSACSSAIYPEGKDTKRAYKSALKESSAPYKKFIPVKLSLDSLGMHQWTAPSPNFNIRTPQIIVIHHTAQDGCEQSLKTLTNPETTAPVSAHYLICKDGTVFNLVDEHYRAWHAGLSRWGNIRNVNSVSVGIELDNNGKEAFAPMQIQTLLVLLRSLKDRYGIPTGNFVGHGDIAPLRKEDPSSRFPWEELAERGFGYYPDQILDSVPGNFDPVAALKVIGYEIQDMRSAIIAFKRHFIQKDLNPVLDETDKEALYNVYLKYLNEAP